MDWFGAHISFQEPAGTSPLEYLDQPKIFRSQAANDGWILESSETSGVVARF